MDGVDESYHYTQNNQSAGLYNSMGRFSLPNVDARLFDTETTNFDTIFFQRVLKRFWIV